MAVAAETVRQWRRTMAEGIEADTSHLQALDNLAALIGFMVATSRAEGRGDALDDVELLVRVMRHDKGTIAEAAQLLGALGYAEVARLLRKLAGRAKRKPTWLERMARKRRRLSVRQV